LRRKIFTAVIALALAATVAEAKGPDVLEIKEKMFVTQTNDIYLNPDEYIGRTIRLEGMFGVIDDVSPPCYYVYRFGPGCCGYDANAGFEVIWENSGESYPGDNDWVEATGALEQYKLEGESFLRLKLDSLVVKAERGKERVEQ
jgi:uncharacterized membrane protein YcgQ (UPF0703/DUF1980 family)